MRNIKTPRLQQRHYEFIAEVISKLETISTKDAIVAAFVRACKADNSNFKPHLFRRASGVEE